MITNEEIKKNLNELRIIGPNPEFKRALKAVVLNHKPERRVSFRLPFFRIAGALAVFVLIVTALTLELSPTPVLSSSFNPDALEKEFENLTINVQIEEIEYREKANQTIASALNEIENTNVKHLNSSLLQDEADNINLNDSTNPEIDALLETVIF